MRPTNLANTHHYWAVLVVVAYVQVHALADTFDTLSWNPGVGLVRSIIAIAAISGGFGVPAIIALLKSKKLQQSVSLQYDIRFAPYRKARESFIQKTDDAFLKSIEQAARDTIMGVLETREPTNVQVVQIRYDYFRMTIGSFVFAGLCLWLTSLT